MRKYKKKLLNTGLDYVKATSKKVVHKAGKFIGNKIADVVTKSNDDDKPNEKPRNIEKVVIPPKKRDEILNKFRKLLRKWNTMKYLNY